MHRSLDQAATIERSRWLAELALAVDQAQQLASRLGIIEGDSREAKELYGRLETVRGAFQALRFWDWAGGPEEVYSSSISDLLSGTIHCRPPG